MFAVFIKRGGADGGKLTTSELGLEQVAGIGAAFGLARADDGMQLIDEKDDFTRGVGDFFEESLEPVLELAAVFRTCEHTAQVQSDDSFVFHRIGHVAGNDAPGEAFDDGGLADAGFTDEHGVVFRAAGKHLHHPADLVVAADNGIDLARACARRKVSTILFERLVFSFRIFIGDLLAAAHGLDRLLCFGFGEAGGFEELAGGRIRLERA